MASTVTRTGIGHLRVANPKVVEARATLRSATGTIGPMRAARGRYGRKGKKGGKGKKGKVRITTADGDNKVTSYVVDAYTVDMIAKIKEKGGHVMTAEQAKQHKAASTEAKFQSLIQ